MKHLILKTEVKKHESVFQVFKQFACMWC